VRQSVAARVETRYNITSFGRLANKEASDVAGTNAEYRLWVESNPLRSWRNSQQPKQTMMKVAVALDVSMATIQLWESGTHTPHPQNFTKIGKLMDNENIEEEWMSWYQRRPEQY
jgi:hypothetical protein